MDTEQLNQKLIDACAKDEISTVKKLLEKGADVNTNIYRFSPLETAISYTKNVELVELLIHAGANVNHECEDNCNRTPIFKAIEEISREKNPPKEYNYTLEHSKKPIAYIGKPKEAYAIFTLLIENGADINHADSYGETPLMNAIFDINIVQDLLEKGALLESENIYGESAILKTTLSANIEAAKLLYDSGAHVDNGLFDKMLSRYTQVFKENDRSTYAISVLERSLKFLKWLHDDLKLTPTDEKLWDWVKRMVNLKKDTVLDNEIIKDNNLSEIYIHNIIENSFNNEDSYEKYADFLQKNGESLRAELINSQINWFKGQEENQIKLADKTINTFYTKICPDTQLLNNFLEKVKIEWHWGHIDYIHIYENTTKYIAIIEKILETPISQFIHTIHVPECHFNNIPSIEGINILQELDMTSNPISDLSILKNAVNLKHLFLNNTNITDVTPLQELSNLEVIHICNTNVSDISPLTNLLKLKELLVKDSNVELKNAKAFRKTNKLVFIDIAETTAEAKKRKRKEREESWIRSQL